MMEKIKYCFVEPLNRWEMVINCSADYTGSGDAGLFCEAKTIREAKRYLLSLIKIIRENNLVEDFG